MFFHGNNFLVDDGILAGRVMRTDFAGACFIDVVSGILRYIGGYFVSGNVVVEITFAWKSNSKAG